MKTAQTPNRFDVIIKKDKKKKKKSNNLPTKKIVRR